MSSIAGNLSGVLCKVRRGANKQSGPYVEYTYEGPRDTIYGMLAQVANADDWHIDHEGPKHTLTARYSSPQDGQAEKPVDEFRLHANRVTVSIFNHPRYAALSSEDKLYCKLVANGDTPPVALTKKIEVAFGIIAVVEDTDSDRVKLLKELIRTLRDGVEHTPVNQPVIIRSRVASSEFNYTSLNGPYSNIGRIISPGSIIADAGLADVVRTVLPSGGNDGTYVYGWLKHFPEYSEASGNKGVFTQEYEWGRWLISLFGDAI